MLSQDFFQRLKLPDLDDVSQYISNVSTPVLVSMGVVAAAATYYLATRPKASPPVCDLRMQSVEVPVSDQCGSVNASSWLSRTAPHQHDTIFLLWTCNIEKAKETLMLSRLTCPVSACERQRQVKWQELEDSKLHWCSKTNSKQTAVYSMCVYVLGC